jgi:hypothetical protein
MAVLSKGTTYANGDQVTSGGLNNLVDNATFVSGAVDGVSTQLSSGAIIVKDGGVSTAKLADNAVTTAKITNSNVTTAKIADANVTTAKIADSNVTTAKIADSNVTKAKIEDVANMKVLGNTSGSATAPQEVSVLDEDNMASNSATSLATQQSIKAYVDSAAPIPGYNRLRVKLFPTDFIDAIGLRLQGNGALLDLDGSASGNDNVRYASCDIPNGYRAVSVTVTGDDTAFGAYEGNFSGATDTTFLGSGNATNPNSPLTVTFSSPVVATDTNYITIGIRDGGGEGRFFGCYVTFEAV